ncbi:MAG: hypothetical protein EOP60_01840, partial [Sphingomonadales bacterium]
MKATTLRILVAGVSSLAIASPLWANPRIIFSSATANGAPIAAGDLPTGPVRVSGGVTQLRMDDGAIVSFVGNAEFSVDASGRLVVVSGTFTAGAGNGPLMIVTPQGTSTTLPGAGAAVSMAVTPNGLLSGFALGGPVSVTSGGQTQAFPNPLAEVA